MGIINVYSKQIRKLCEHHKVRTLYAFGSVNTDRFTNESDIDLVVDFKTKDPLEYTEHYFDLKFELEDVLNRKIDLLESKAIKNPFLKENIEKTKVLIYG